MALTFFALFGLLYFAGAAAPPYYVGVGRYDVTGPAADVNMVLLPTLHAHYWLHSRRRACMHVCASLYWPNASVVCADGLRGARADNSWDPLPSIQSSLHLC